MAKGATIYKAELKIADMDADFYADDAVTLACHPSETEERMMVRLLAYVMHAQLRPDFGRGVSTADEPDLWSRDMTGSIQLWVELGHPDERALRRASGKAERVTVVCYSGRSSRAWWNENREALEKIRNLTVVHLDPAGTQALAGIVDRTMQLQCNIQDGVITIIRGADLVQIETETWLKS